MQLEQENLDAFLEAAKKLDEGFAGLPAFESKPAATERIAEALSATAARLQDNYPYFHPLYAGQMLKPPHPAARLAYALAMWINPNNHALDGGRATSAMEKEAVAQIAEMFGWKEFLGHLCGGGTMANLEALWVAAQTQSGKKILASEQSHYTHKRISAVLQLPFEIVECDSRGRMDVNALAKRVTRGDVGTVVATMGTTATGSVDPLPEILALRGKYGFRVHADAAYGGYFVLADNLGVEAARAFARIGEADSIVIDPHKHGLQPYGCGCVLFRDASAGRF
ncbi:MAG: aminotransferase class I/II-fold pyridoxal phosphate-dependent enzyme, partial [Candidatus Acidiferrum sp.]